MNDRIFKDSKAILSGPILELFRYYGYGGQFDRPIGSWREMSLRRARTALRRRINANAGLWRDPVEKVFYKPLFVTLTFREKVEDIRWANREFSKFVMRFNYHVFGSRRARLKYVTVIEFQERGAVHYHSLFFNCPFVPGLKTRLFELWGHAGNEAGVDFKSIRKVRVVGNYLVKYMSKEFDDPRLHGKKTYFTSRGLTKPLTFRDDFRIADMLSLVPEGVVPQEVLLPGVDYTRYWGMPLVASLVRESPKPSFVDNSPIDRTPSLFNN